MTPDEIIALNDQIAGMARAGLPLDRGLSAMAREMRRGRLRKVTNALADDLRNGVPLPVALERRRDQLPPYYSSLALAGIRTGRLAEVLATLTTYARTIAAMRTMILDAIAYPIMVTVFALFVFAFLSFVIMPQFQQLYEEFKLPIPAATRLMMIVTNHPMLYVVVPLFAIALMCIVMWFAIRQTASGHRAWTRFVYSMPLIGTLIRSARLAAYVELLSILVRNSVPLPESFQLAGEAGSDPFIAEQSKEVRQQLEQGCGLGQALTGRELLPEWVAWMSAAGERQGSLGNTLHEIAGVYRRHVESRAAILRNLMPAVLIVVVACVIVPMYVVGLGLPLVDLIEGLSK